jgi:hypothetical protein
MVAQLGAECCHLVGEVLDTLLKCVTVGEWPNAREYQPFIFPVSGFALLPALTISSYITMSRT